MRERVDIETPGAAGLLNRPVADRLEARLTTAASAPETVRRRVLILWMGLRYHRGRVRGS